MITTNETTTSNNFFKAGGTLHLNTPSYVPRAADEELFKRLLAGQFCYVLTSRQMGKSSLMIRTAARLRGEGVQTAIIDLSGLGTQVSSSQWYLGLLTRLGNELKLAFDVEVWWQERSALSVVQRFTDFMHDVVLVQVTGRVVIFIDEIDSTLKLDFTDDFFAAIRTFYNARASDPIYERLTFALLGVATPSELIKNRNLTPFNIGYALDLQELSRADAQPLADGLNQRFPGQGDTILDQIFAWTNGHPYLTQKLCVAATDEAFREDQFVGQVDSSTLPGRWAASQRFPMDANELGSQPPNIDALVQRLFLDKDAQNEDNLQFVRSNVTAGKDKRRLLQLYRRIYTGKSVGEDTRSLLHNRLKLIGLVRTAGGVLQVRNQIYERVFNLAWIKQSIPIDWARIVTVSSAVVAVVAISVLLYVQWQNEVRRFAINRETFVDQDASVNVRMISLAQMCEMRPAESRTEFGQLTDDEQLALFRAANLTVIGERFFAITDCLQDETVRMNAPLQEIVHEKVEGWCAYHAKEMPHPRCNMKQRAHE